MANSLIDQVSESFDQDETWYDLGGYLAVHKRCQEALACYTEALRIDCDYRLAQKPRREILQAFPGLS